MKRFVRIVLLSLVLITVAMVSALTAMRFAIHGREVAVPKLTRMSRIEAENLANQNGLVFHVENRFYSKDVPAGQMLSQSPTAGTLVRRGWTVRAAESLGLQRAEVPRLVGQSVRAAEINIRRRGLEIGTIATANIPDQFPDQIIAQNPTPDSVVVESPKISVLLAAPAGDQRFVMPDFLGKHIADVAPQIEDAGFLLGRISDPDALVPDPSSLKISKRAPKTPDARVIIRQTPAAGQKIPLGATISFEVSH